MMTDHPPSDARIDHHNMLETREREDRLQSPTEHRSLH
jgi:hypothetical protein